MTILETKHSTPGWEHCRLLCESQDEPLSAVYRGCLCSLGLSCTVVGNKAGRIGRFPIWCWPVGCYTDIFSYSVRSLYSHVAPGPSNGVPLPLKFGLSGEKSARMSRGSATAGSTGVSVPLTKKDERAVCHEAGRGLRAPPKVTSIKSRDLWSKL